MKRILLLLACFTTLAACGSDSSLPNPTGKGAVRMINAIPGSPEIRFLIEERQISSAGYKVSTAPVEYDDFSYRFNFEIALPGESTLTRTGSRTITVENGGDHIFVLSGDLLSPDITVWDGDIRTFDAADTVLEARFAHGSATLGDIDVYFDPAGTVPGTNPPAATLAFGEIADPIDYEAGEYVLTVTAASDVNTVHFTAQAVDLLAQFAHVITVFDGDANDTGRAAVRSMTSVGNPLEFQDVSAPPSVRFIHASYETQAVDIYDDELLTNLVAENIPFRGTSVDLDTTTDARTYYFTPAGSTAQVLFQQEFLAVPAATYSHFYIVGTADNQIVTGETPDRAPNSTSAKLTIFNGSTNYEFVDLFLVERGAEVTSGTLPTLVGIGFANLSPAVELLEGSYDIYLGDSRTRDVISPALPVDLANGDVLDLIAVDTVDPAVLEAVDISLP